MQEVLIICTVALFWAMSPWPDFILVMKNNLLYGLKKWIFTSLGVWAGVLVHITYCIAWIWFIVSQSIMFFNFIKIVWALFFLSVFTQVLNPWISYQYQAFLGFIMMIIITLWFIMLSFLLNMNFIQKQMSGFQYWVEKIMGWFLAFMWIKILSE